jgi:FKBP-type peptidyl-prolyl cis-trans isomerase FkpA
MRITTVLFGLLLLLCVACDKSERKTPSGLKYKVIKAGTGKAAQPNDVLILNFKLMDARDSVWSSTYETGMPAGVMIPDTSSMKFDDDMMQVLRQVSGGDSIAVSFTTHDFFAKLVRRPRPSHLDSAMLITYYLKIDSVATQEVAMKLQQEMSERKQKEQLTKDITTIDEYLTSNKIDAQKTESGIRYVISVPGKGEICQSGQVVKVDYTGTLLDGKCFDTSNKEAAQAKGVFNEGRNYAPYEVTIDRSSVIQGWHEALKLMKKGEKATFYIPSGLAYGPQGRGAAIKPNTVLVFDMEVVDVKNSADEK